ncbi:VOC family protein [Pseudonocardia sp. HH130630-07]|uniref:VOC family protein n=1 Tax=Pseudonocardia sp. HH130630-07 TaxID=1690815 RepID=UPI000814D1B5|nr:VOC family protein [Pseudonocardia sp. HH130630-07]ANY07343.1 hypothetical protein AFB00_14790 [Pseudonocardia sp. HH130630-07]
MGISWAALTIDAHDPAACARWWAETLGGELCEPNPHGVEVRPPGGAGPSLFFVPGAADKRGKNRLHLDLLTPDPAATLAWLERRGARRVDIGQGDAPGWSVLRDPEGNEFCLLEPAGQ